MGNSILEIPMSGKVIDGDILLFSYWEHVKADKELARALPPDHPKRIMLNKVINELTAKINCSLR